LELIESQLVETQKQQSKFLDLYLSGDFPKEILLERTSRLQALATDLRKELAQLATFLQKITYSDADNTTIEVVCTKIHDKLGTVTFEGKRRILDMLDVRGTLAIEKDEKVIYISCPISPEPVSLVLTSTLSSCHGVNTIALTVWIILDRLQEQGNQISLADMLFSQTNLALVW
jgi:hypothetical protein